MSQNPFNLPLESCFQILKLIPSKGLLRLVNPCWRDFVDEFFSDDDQENLQICLSDCLKTESLFTFATARNNKRFGVKDVKAAMKKKQLGTSVLPHVVPIMVFKTFLSLIENEQAELLNLITNEKTTTAFPFQHPNEWDVFRWHTFLIKVLQVSCAKTFEWGSRFLNDFFKSQKFPDSCPVFLILSNYYETLSPQSPVIYLKNNVVAFKRIIEKYSAAFISTKTTICPISFSVSEWIDLHPFFEQWQKQGLRLEVCIPYRLKFPSPDQLTLPVLKQFCQDICQFTKLYTFNVPNPLELIFKEILHLKLFIPLNDNNQIELVKYLLYDFTEWQQCVLDSFFLSPEVLEPNPMTFEYASFWFDSDPKSFGIKKKLLHNYHQFNRLWRNDQVDLFSQFALPLLNDHDSLFFNVLSLSECLFEPKTVQKSPRFFKLFYQLVLTEKNWKQVMSWMHHPYTPDPTNSDRYFSLVQLWKQSAYKDSPFALSCLMKIAMKNNDDLFIEFQKYVCQGTFDEIDQEQPDSEMMDWIMKSLAISPILPTLIFSPRSLCFKSVDHLKHFFKAIDIQAHLNVKNPFRFVDFQRPNTEFLPPLDSLDGFKSPTHHSHKIIKEAITYLKKEFPFETSSTLWDKHKLPPTVEMYLFLMEEIKAPLLDQDEVKNIFKTLVESNYLDLFPRFVDYHMESTKQFFHFCKIWEKQKKWVLHNASLETFHQMIQIEQNVFNKYVVLNCSTKNHKNRNAKKPKLQSKSKSKSKKESYPVQVKYPVWYTGQLTFTDYIRFDVEENCDFYKTTLTRFEKIVAEDTKYNFLQPPFRLACLFKKDSRDKGKYFQYEFHHDFNPRHYYLNFYAGIEFSVCFGEGESSIKICAPAHMKIRDLSKKPKHIKLLQKHQLVSFVQMCDRNKHIAFSSNDPVHFLSEQELVPCARFSYLSKEFVLPLSSTKQKLCSLFPQLFHPVMFKTRKFMTHIRNQNPVMIDTSQFPDPNATLKDMGFGVDPLYSYFFTE